MPIQPKGSIAQVKREARKEISRYSKRPQYRGRSKSRCPEPPQSQNHHPRRPQYPSKYEPSPYGQPQHEKHGRPRGRPQYAHNPGYNNNRLW